MEQTTDTDTSRPPREQPAGGTDDRRGMVDPATDPRPVNPPVDDEAVDKGREVLDRVKPY
jgi:hypothetical protein